MKPILLLASCVFIACFLQASNAQDVAQDTAQDAAQVKSDAQQVADDLKPEYELQGEYVGGIATGANDLDIATQVIALGDGKFEIVGFLGGLPGDGWDEGDVQVMDGKLEDGQVIFGDERFEGVISDGIIIISLPDGTEVGDLEKVERESDTLGKKPPEGAFVLFDGTNTDHFEPAGNTEQVRMTEDGLLMEGANSKQKFGDCELHIEFRLPFEPKNRGQQRGNSGVYLQGRYEVQLLDSFGLAGEQNECGAVYGIAAPNINMCFPPLTWQTYDIDFRAARFNEAGEKTENARITVKHNGVVIHQDLELPKTTTAAPVAESAEPGYLHLQNHNNPVRFRNIWIVEK